MLVSGAWLTGLVQNTNRLLIGGSSCISPVSAAPSWRLLITRVPGLIQSGRASLHPVDREVPERHLQQAAADMPPGADQRRQAAHRADRLTAAGVPLERDAEADHGGLSGGELAGELARCRPL